MKALLAVALAATATIAVTSSAYAADGSDLESLVVLEIVPQLPKARDLEQPPGAVP